MTDETKEKVPEVYSAISRVSAAISKIGISKDKEAKNQSGGVMYNFRGIDDVFNALSPLLAKEKLVITPRVISRECVERTTRAGSVLFFVTVEVEFDLVSGVDGSRHTVRTYGEAQDSGDKATNKALSAAYKYMSLIVFCIPIIGRDDADETGGVDLKPTEKPETSGKPGRAPKPTEDKSTPEEPEGETLFSLDQVTEISDKIKESGVDVNRLLSYYGKRYSRPFSSVSELPASCYQNTIDQIAAAKARLAKSQEPK